jgi:hypothetical protein
MASILEELATTVWRTSGTRYNAARRLKRRELVSIASLSFFSAFTIVIAFIQRVLVTAESPALDNYLSVLSMCLGLFILVLTLIEWGAGCALKADVLHRNAEELNVLQRKIWYCIKINGEAGNNDSSFACVDGFREDYEDIKAKCQYNHEPIDDSFFRAVNRFSAEFLIGQNKPKMCICESFYTHVIYWFSSIWYFTLFWVVISVVTYLTPWPFGAFS